MPQKYVRVCVCVRNSAGISQALLSRAGDPEKAQTEMEGVKGSQGERKKRESLIFIDMRIMMVPNRECEQRLVDKGCVCVCIYGVGENTFGC